MQLGVRVYQVHGETFLKLREEEEEEEEDRLYMFQQRHTSYCSHLL